MKLIDRLKEVQKAEGLSDAKFAEKMDIHRTTWIRIKTNQIGLSTRVLQNVLGVYPGLKKEVNIFLLENATNSSKQGGPN
jgi:transcriptional regulator with XRE-family HTH domain